MNKKQLRLVAVLGVLGSLLLSGCGDDVEVMIPKSDFVYGEQLHTGKKDKHSSALPEIVETDIKPITTPEPTPLPTPEPTAEPKPEQDIVTITISAAGDCSLGNHQEQDYSLSFRQAYDEEGGAEYFLRNVKDIFASDDMTIVNLEGVLTTSEDLQPGRTYNIKGDPSYARILSEGNVEAVSMGNNHRQDFGEAGTADTEDALEAEEILYAYDKNVAIYETKGIRIGYVSVNEVAWGYGSEALIQEGIEKLQAEEVDLIFVACHWGIERDNYPEAYQLQLGKKCIDMGADLVIGHHPHVLQGIEEYNGKIIIHSLGNFCFGANRSPADKDTMIFQQTFTFIDGEKQEDMEAKVIPCSISSISNRNNFQPTPLEGEDAKRVIDRLNTYSADMGMMVSEDGKLQKK